MHKNGIQVIEPKERILGVLERLGLCTAIHHLKGTERANFQEPRI